MDFLYRDRERSVDLSRYPTNANHADPLVPLLD